MNEVKFIKIKNPNEDDIIYARALLKRKNILREDLRPNMSLLGETDKHRKIDYIFKSEEDIREWKEMEK